MVKEFQPTVQRQGFLMDAYKTLQHAFFSIRINSPSVPAEKFKLRGSQSDRKSHPKECIFLGALKESMLSSSI